MHNNLTNRGLFLLSKLVRKELDKRGIKFLPINPADYTFKSKLSLYDIQKIATKICRHYYLWGYTPVVTYERLSSAAGNINLNMDLNIFINLDNSKEYSNEQIISILAHEIAHKFLFVNFIRYEGLKNEFITDATAVCAGFGNIMANSCVSRTEHENSTTIINLGYLTEWQIRYLIDCFCGRITEEPSGNDRQHNKDYTDDQEYDEYEYLTEEPIEDKEGTSYTNLIMITSIFVLICLWLFVTLYIIPTWS